MGWEAEKKCCSVVNSQGQHKHREVGGKFCLISRHNIMKMNGERDFREKKKKKTWGRRSGSLQGFGVDPDLALLWCWSHKALTTKDAPRPTSTGSCGAGHIKEDLVKKSYTLCPTGWKLGILGGSGMNSCLCCSSSTWEELKR